MSELIQLRPRDSDTAATRIRRQFGLEAAQLTLGHASALITHAIHAEPDYTKAIEIMKQAG